MCMSLAACAFLLILSVLPTNQQVLGTRQNFSAGADKELRLCSQDYARLLTSDRGQNVLLLPKGQRKDRLTGPT